MAQFPRDISNAVINQHPARGANRAFFYTAKKCNLLTFINVKYLHHTKFICNFVASKIKEILTNKAQRK